MINKQCSGISPNCLAPNTQHSFAYFYPPVEKKLMFIKEAAKWGREKIFPFS